MASGRVSPAKPHHGVPSGLAAEPTRVCVSAAHRDIRHGLFSRPSVEPVLGAVQGGGGEPNSIDLALFRLQAELDAPPSDMGREARIVAHVAALRDAGISPDQHDALALHLIDAGIAPATGELVGREAAYVERFGDRPRNHLVARAATLPDLLHVLRDDNLANYSKLLAYLQRSADGASAPLFVSVSPLLRYVCAQRLHDFTERLRWLVFGPIDRQLTRECDLRALLRPPIDWREALSEFRAVRDRLAEFGVDGAAVFELAAQLESAAETLRQYVESPPTDVAEHVVHLVAALPLAQWPIQHATYSVKRSRAMVLADLRAYLSGGEAAATHLPKGMGLHAAALRLREAQLRRAGERFQQAPDAFAVLRAEVEAARDGAGVIAALQDWPHRQVPGNGHAVERSDVLRVLRRLFPSVGASQGSYFDLPLWLRAKAKALLEARQPSSSAISTFEPGVELPAALLPAAVLERGWDVIKAQMRQAIQQAAALAGPQPGWQPEEGVEELVSQFFAGHPVYLREITREGRLREAVEKVMRAVIAFAERHCAAQYWQHSRRNPYTGESLHASASTDEAHFRLAVMIIRQQRGRDPLPGLRPEQVRVTLGILAQYFPTFVAPLQADPRLTIDFSDEEMRRMYDDAVQSLRRSVLTHDDPQFHKFWATARPVEKRAVLKAFFGPFFHLDVEAADAVTAYTNAARAIEAIGEGGCYREVGLTLWVDTTGALPRLQFRLSAGDPASVSGEGGEFFWLGHTHPERPQRPRQWADLWQGGEAKMTILQPAAVLPEERTFNIFPSHEIPRVMSGGDLEVIRANARTYERSNFHRALGKTPFYDPLTDSYLHDVIHATGRSRVRYFPARPGRAERMVITWALNAQRRAAGVALDDSWMDQQSTVAEWGRRNGVVIEWEDHADPAQLQMANR